MNYKIESATITISDKLWILYYRGKGFYPVFTLSKLNKFSSQYAAFKSFTISNHALCISFKGYFKAITKEDCYQDLDELIELCTQWDMNHLRNLANNAFGYNPKSHIKIGDTTMYKSVFKKQLLSIVNNLNDQ